MANAGPRKGWHTDILLLEASDGAVSARAEIQRFDLFNLERYTGCISCFGCKQSEHIISAGGLLDDNGKIICRIGRCIVGEMQMNSSNDTFFLGADGCMGGWIVAALGSTLRIERLSSIGEILETYPGYSTFLIDMVIRLRDSAKQLRPDDIARKELKPRGSTLFPVPSKEAVYKDTYEEQKKANIKTLGKSLSRQASAIIPKIREIDEYLSSHPEFKNRIDESHSELDFARLNGSILLTRKKDAAGIDERLKVIKHYIPGIRIPDLYAKAKELRCNADDIADAICLAVTAKLKSEGLCETIPENQEMDNNGLYMKLTVPAAVNGRTGTICT